LRAAGPNFNIRPLWGALSVDGMDEEEKGGAGSIVVLVAAILVALVWALTSQITGMQVVKALASGDIAGAAGMILGDATFKALVVAAVAYVAVWRRNAPARAGRYVVILLVATIALNGGAIALLYQYAHGVAARKDAQLAQADSEISRALASAGDPSGPGIDMRIHSTGDAGIVERDAKVYAAALRDAALDYRAQVAAAGYPAFLGPDKLQTARARAAAAQKITDLRAKLKAFRDGIARKQIDFRARFARETIDDRLKTEFLRGFDAKTAELAPVQDQILARQDAIFADFAAMVDVLSHPHAVWVMKGKTLLFGDPRDREAFNRYGADIRMLSATNKSVVANANQHLQGRPQGP
jgi:hypothetical protein